jgi:hypothetical protein
MKPHLLIGFGKSIKAIGVLYGNVVCFSLHVLGCYKVLVRFKYNLIQKPLQYRSTL